MPTDFTLGTESPRVWGLTEALGGTQTINHGASFTGPILDVTGLRRFVLYVNASSANSLGLMVALAEYDPLSFPTGSLVMIPTIAAGAPQFTPIVLAPAAAWYRLECDDTVATVTVMGIRSALLLVVGAGVGTAVINNMRLFGFEKGLVGVSAF